MQESLQIQISEKAVKKKVCRTSKSTADFLFYAGECSAEDFFILKIIRNIPAARMSVVKILPSIPNLPPVRKA